MINIARGSSAMERRISVQAQDGLVVWRCAGGIFILAFLIAFGLYVHNMEVQLQTVRTELDEAVEEVKALKMATALTPARKLKSNGDPNERTFIAIKPDGVQRGLIGNIIVRFEQKGFKLVGMKLLHASQDRLEKHYAYLKERPFFPDLVEYMASGPIVAMVWQGLDAVRTGRSMLGETDPVDSKPGTIRGDYAIHIGRNICHGSDSVKSAIKEIKLWFNDSELSGHRSWAEPWIYE